MKFAVDAMLGTLAKWLRILGFDACYDQTLSDHQLVRLARAEARVLLTRDRQLARRRGLHVLLIRSDDLESQIRQVLTDLGLELTRPGSRCPVCNGQLEPMDHEVARSQVPDFVAKTHRAFTHCPACRRIYWRGTHWQRMEGRLDRLQEQAKTDKDVMEANPGIN